MGLCLSCGGIVDESIGSDGASAAMSNQLFPPGPDEADSTRPDDEDCSCNSGPIIELTGPNGMVIYDRPSSTGSTCSDQFDLVSTDDCLDLLFSACSVSGECLFLARTNTGALLHLTDSTGSSLRSVGGPRQSVTVRKEQESIQGEFLFDDLSGARYWGTLQLCGFEARQIDDECSAP
jgi:hypothetical protein